MSSVETGHIPPPPPSGQESSGPGIDAATSPAPSVEVPVDDRPLMIGLRRGDADAFGRLVERYMRRAHRVAVGLVGMDDAMDLTQDAFVRAFRACSTVDPDRPFFPWYYQILRRLCLNALRNRKTRRQTLAGMTPWLVADAGFRARVDCPEDRLSRSQNHSKLQKAIDQLPPAERETLTLREYEELSYKEIAELTQVPIGTVMSRLYSARKKLARHWPQDSRT